MRTLTRAQSGVELLIILAVGIVILGFVLSTSQQRLGSSQQALAFSLAQNSVNELGKTADAVYFEGVGARRQVSITLPEGTVATSVSSNSIGIRVASGDGFSDASANTQADLCLNSQLPTRAGTYSITVESFDGCVGIGALSNLTVSTTLIAVNLQPNSWSLRSVNYSNQGDTPILVNLNLSFISADAAVVFMNPADEIFTINPSQTREVVLNLSASQVAFGSYSGVLAANGSNGDNLTTSIVLEVFSQTCLQQTCPAGGSGVAKIGIKTYSSGSYSQLKEIFDPTEVILVQGGQWDAATSLSLDVRDPTDSFSLQGYPKSLTTNSSGGFNDTLNSAGLQSLSGYIIKASGLSGGNPKTKIGNFDVIACT